MPKRYEQEIDEIMGRVGDLGPRRPLRQHFKEARSRFGAQFSLEVSRAFGWITPGLVGGIGVVLLIAGLVVKTPYLIIIALSLMLGAYLLSITRSRATHRDMTGYDKTWRGRPVEHRSDSGWRDRLRRWMGKDEE